MCILLFNSFITVRYLLIKEACFRFHLLSLPNSLHTHMLLHCIPTGTQRHISPFPSISSQLGSFIPVLQERGYSLYQRKKVSRVHLIWNDAAQCRTSQWALPAVPPPACSLLEGSPDTRAAGLWIHWELCFPHNLFSKPSLVKELLSLQDHGHRSRSHLRH